MAIENRNRAAQDTTPSTSFTATYTPTTPSSKTRPATSAPTIKTLYEAYSTLCTQDSLLHPLSSSEFREVIGSLETLSLIAPVDGKNGSFTSSLQVGGTPGSKRGRKKKDVFGLNGTGGGLAADEKRVASCVGEREMEAAVGEGMGEGILRGILAGEGLD
jgi:cell division control protein 6